MRPRPRFTTHSPSCGVASTLVTVDKRILTTLIFDSVVIESNLRGVEQAQEEFSLNLGVDDGV